MSKEGLRRRVLRGAGATGALAGLAGCASSGETDGENGDAESESSDEEESDDGNTTDAGSDDANDGSTDEEDDSPGAAGEGSDSGDEADNVEVDLLDAFGDVLFDEGNLLVEVADDVELDAVVLRDPHGRHVDQDMREAGEGTAKFELDTGSSFGSSPMHSGYPHGTYTVLGFQAAAEADVEPDGTVVTDGLALVAAEEYDVEPDPQLVGVQGSGEDGEAEFVIRNEGTGTWPMYYRGAHTPDTNLGHAGGWQEEGYLPPGEETTVTARTRTDREYDDSEQASEEFCNGETVERIFYLYVDLDDIREYRIGISLDGEAILHESFIGSGGTVYCGELDDEEIERT